MTNDTTETTRPPRPWPSDAELCGVGLYPVAQGPAAPDSDRVRTMVPPPPVWPSVERARKVIDHAASRTRTAQERAMVTEAEVAAAGVAFALESGKEPAYRALAVLLLKLESIALRPEVSPVMVPSSDGVTLYSLKRDGFGWHCSCPGFRHRGRCKHVAGVVAVEVRP